MIDECNTQTFSVYLDLFFATIQALSKPFIRVLVTNTSGLRIKKSGLHNGKVGISSLTECPDAYRPIQQL